MREIDIRKQPRMGPIRAMVMTLHGIRYRLFRSAVTVMVIAVAVAFLMNVACESVVTGGVIVTARQQIADARLLVRWIAHLTVVPSDEDTLRRLASGDAAFTREVERMTGDLAPDALDRLAASAREAVGYLDFFAGLDYGRARRLAHRSRGTAIFDRLQVDARRREFRETLEAMREIRLPGETAEFIDFLERWPALRADIGRIRTGREGAIRAVADALGTRPPMEALADANGAFGESIRQAGFELPPELADELARHAIAGADTRRVGESLAEPALRGAVAARLDILPADLDETALWRLLEDADDAAWYHARLVATDHAAAAIEPDRLSQLAQRERRNRVLLRTERHIDTGLTDGAGMGDRIAWLLLASVVVCMVGIANAMLMAVTERFREIATLKCLGALDGTILIMFLLEASLLGVAGGVAGALLGMLIGMGRMAVRFRGLLWGAVPWGDLVAAMGASLLLGIVLAAAASVYPSLKAARLAPMEAMRIE